jgi:hypothetical protein
VLRCANAALDIFRRLFKKMIAASITANARTDPMTTPAIAPPDNAGAGVGLDVVFAEADEVVFVGVGGIPFVGVDGAGVMVLAIEEFAGSRVPLEGIGDDVGSAPPP